MIVSVTPNPSVDRTLVVDHLVRGEVVRAGRAQVDPGGKGINVVRVLTANGVPAIAVLPVGGAEGRQLVDLLTTAGIRTHRTPITGAIRANVSIVEPDGTVTKLNEAGPVLTRAEVTALLDATRACAADAGWVVCCGSLPDGVGDDFTADVVRSAQAVGARAAVDTSGAPLLAALPAGPDLIKPNLEELADAVGEPVVTLGDAVAAAQQLRSRGACNVLASLGADGAILVSEGLRLHAEASVSHPVSAVGAGDATLAGFLTRTDPVQALRAAVAWGAAAVQLPGSTMPGPADIHLDRVRVTDDLDLTRPLHRWQRGDDLARTPRAEPAPLGSASPGTDKRSRT
ncbi:MAG TPA: 1-phosphofructokinase [Euzebya sp.]|nr:1-phosphofructokinase [Euzebya sp.]